MWTDAAVKLLKEKYEAAGQWQDGASLYASYFDKMEKDEDTGTVDMTSMSVATMASWAGVAPTMMRLDHVVAMKDYINDAKDIEDQKQRFTDAVNLLSAELSYKSVMTFEPDPRSRTYKSGSWSTSGQS